MHMSRVIGMCLCSYLPDLGTQMASTLSGMCVEFSSVHKAIKHPKVTKSKSFCGACVRTILYVHAHWYKHAANWCDSPATRNSKGVAIGVDAGCRQDYNIADVGNKTYMLYCVCIVTGHGIETQASVVRHT